jgi:uncharacterized protein YhhL (DUF1145 family)
MHAQVFKNIFSITLILVVSLMLPLNTAYAAPLDLERLCQNLDVEGNVAGGNTINHLSPLKVVCPFARLLNVALYSAGIVFVIMLVYGGIKLSMAQGDPKAMQAVKGTWTWAVIGFGVVIGFIALLSIATGLFGISFDILNPFGYVADGINQFLCAIGVETQGFPCRP